MNILESLHLVTKIILKIISIFTCDLLYSQGLWKYATTWQLLSLSFNSMHSKIILKNISIFKCGLLYTKYIHMNLEKV